MFNQFFIFNLTVMVNPSDKNIDLVNSVTIEINLGTIMLLYEQDRRRSSKICTQDKGLGYFGNATSVMLFRRHAIII